MEGNLNKKIVHATKWSAITELAAKLVTPVVSMVLARLLTPDAFGVVATLTMIISFAEIFTDAGFQKYLVQHEFIDDKDREESTNVAFWSNLFLSIFLWGIISIFCEPLATLVGNQGLGVVLVVACASIPIAAFSSIQIARYKRDLNFKTLFRVRIVSVLIPLVVTVPLALILKSYWALVIGTLVKNAVSALLLTLYSSWKPKIFYSFDKLKEMMPFTIWSMFEQISIWLTSYVDVFIIGTMLNQHYLGLYKTSSNVVSEIMGLVTATTTPILFSSLSRLQNDENEFKTLFFRFQKIVGLLVVPLGVGIFCFSDLVTSILLGDQWLEASGFVGLWGLTSSVTIVLSHYSSEVYRAKGKPKLSVLAQWLHIIVLWPTVLISAKYGFETLYVARSIVRLELIFVNLLIMYLVLKVSPFKMLKNIGPACLSSVIMAGVFYILPSSDSFVVQIAYVVICSIVYLLSVCLYKEERSILLHLKTNLKK